MPSPKRLSVCGVGQQSDRELDIYLRSWIAIRVNGREWSRIRTCRLSVSFRALSQKKTIDRMNENSMNEADNHDFRTEAGEGGTKFRMHNYREASCDFG